MDSGPEMVWYWGGGSLGEEVSEYVVTYEGMEAWPVHG